MAGEVDGRLDGDVAPGPAGDVVDYLWEVHRVRDGAEVGLHPLWFGDVVVRRDEEQAVGAGVGRSLCQVEGLAGVVRSRARDDGHVVVRERLDGRLDHLDVFVVRHRRALAGGADGDHPVDTALDQSLGVLV